MKVLKSMSGDVTICDSYMEEHELFIHFPNDLFIKMNQHQLKLNIYNFEKLRKGGLVRIARSVFNDEQLELLIEELKERLDNQ